MLRCQIKGVQRRSDSVRVEAAASEPVEPGGHRSHHNASIVDYGPSIFFLHTMLCSRPVFQSSLALVVFEATHETRHSPIVICRTRRPKSLLVESSSLNKETPQPWGRSSLPNNVVGGRVVLGNAPRNVPQRTHIPCKSRVSRARKGSAPAPGAGQSCLALKVTLAN